MSEYPKLMWLPDGREITVGSADEETLRSDEGCSALPPGSVPAAPESPEPEPEAEPEPKKKAKKAKDE